jgi:hypothetical protein
MRLCSSGIQPCAVSGVPVLAAFSTTFAAILFTFAGVTVCRLEKGPPPQSDEQRADKTV